MKSTLIIKVNSMSNAEGALQTLCGFLIWESAWNKLDLSASEIVSSQSIAMMAGARGDAVWL